METNVRSIRTSEDLLLKLEEQMGMKNSLTVNYKILAKKLGLGSWSKSLTKKLEKLKQENRIEIIKQQGVRSKFDLNLIKPLTTEEKNNIKFRNLKTKKSTKKETTEMQQIINSLPQNGQLSAEAQKQMLAEAVEQTKTSSNSDIDQIFDDLTNISRNVISKLIELKEENEQLKFLLENAREREKLWIARATTYKQQLISNK